MHFFESILSTAIYGHMGLFVLAYRFESGWLEVFLIEVFF